MAGKTTMVSRVQEHLSVVGSATVTALSIALGVPATNIRSCIYSHSNLFIAHKDMRGYMLRVSLKKKQAIHTTSIPGLGADDADNLRQED